MGHRPEVPLEAQQLPPARRSVEDVDGDPIRRSARERTLYFLSRSVTKWAS
jgi:hypothetical protein